MKAPDFLSHLRTDRAGRPVPVVNRWGLDEDPNRVAVMFDPVVGGNAVFYLDAGETEPNFKAQCMQRQRICMVQGLCQVCGRGIPWRRRCLVISSVSTSMVTSPGPRNGAIVVGEPWLDKRCAQFAMCYCPEMIRRNHGDDLTLIEVTSRHDVELIVKTGSVDGFPETEKKPVALWVDLLVKT